MYELQRKYHWVTQSSDVLGVMRALAPILHAVGRSQHYLETPGYMLSSQSTSIEKAKDLDDAARRVPDPIRTISLKYTTWFRLTTLRSPQCSFKVIATKGHDYLTNPDTSVKVSLDMAGPDTDAIAGLMDRVKTQVESELTQQDADGWRAVSTPMPVITASLGKRLVNHQWFVAIAGGLLVTLIGWAIVAGVNRLNASEDVPAGQLTTTIVPTETNADP